MWGNDKVIAQAALAIWILVSIAFFAFTTPLRAFILTYVIGLLFLPVEVQNAYGWEGAITFTTALRIDKYTACNIGAFVGTALFAPHLFRRFVPNWIDAVYLLIPISIFITSVVNEIGLKDGISNAVANLRIWAPMLFLAKIHISSIADLFALIRAMIAGAVVYAFIAVFEFRFSPWLHRGIYSYFQHDFTQFARYERFRPVGFLRHAIELSFLLGTTTALAVWLWLKKMFPPLWGILPAWGAIVILLIGLACTLTFSGYAIFLLALGIMLLFHYIPSRWVLLILPIFAIAWMTGRYLEVLDAKFLIDTASAIDPSRAESINYRFESETIHLNAAESHLAFGRGGLLGMVRNAQGGLVKAVDAFWLIQLTFFGIVGLGLWLITWTSPIYTTINNWRNITGPARNLFVAICILLGVQLADFLFNSFPSPFLMLLVGGSFGVHNAIRAYRAAAPMAARVPQPMPAGGAF